MAKEILYGLGGIIIGLIVGVLLAQNAVNYNRTGMMGMMGMRYQSNSAVSSTMDAHFIEQMIPHHEDAITMAEIALNRAKRQEVKTLAQDIINSQSKEISQMKIWYKDWYGRELPTGSNVMGQHGMMTGSSMHMGMMGDTTDISRLEEADDFDRVFIEDMIPHHQVAVMMASMLKNGTQRNELRKLADDIVSAQTKEIVIMRSWYKDWYE